MENIEHILEAVFLAVLYLVSFAVYAYMIATLLPQKLLPILYDTKDHLGRGLKKMTYPEGRAVLYEPHPSLRKYIRQYLLFTVDGYKYFQSQIGEGVKRYTASIVCFDNGNHVLDVLDISESLSNTFSQPIRLHHKTSYVAFIISSVNGTPLPRVHFVKTRLASAPLYIAAVAMVSFLLFSYTLWTIRQITDLLSVSSLFSNVENTSFLFPSLIIGVVCLLITLLTRICKKVKVVLK